MKICERLHIILEEGKVFDFKSDTKDMPQNGIYVLYEKGESGHGNYRIVRIGTDTGENQLRSRIFQHFINENKNRSIFRKNIGRALLSKNNEQYLEIWNYDTTTRINKEKYKNFIDKTFETRIEKQISKYMQENFFFRLLEVNGKENRLSLEEKLIGTVSNCRDCKSSKNWLGNFSPIDKIKQSGLWQVQGLYTQGLTEQDLVEIEKCLVK